MPVRLAKPERLTGMADVLRSPAYSTSVGLLRLGLQMENAALAESGSNGSAPGLRLGRLLGGLFRGLLPDEGA